MPMMRVYHFSVNLNDMLLKILLNVFLCLSLGQKFTTSYFGHFEPTIVSNFLHWYQFTLGTLRHVWHYVFFLKDIPRAPTLILALNLPYRRRKH